MSESEIIKLLAKYTDNRKFPYQIPRAFIYNWESDFWTMTTHGETREFEIKVSRADYLIDGKKDKHKETNGANFFYYVCPKDIIKKQEVDPRYGLIYVWDTGHVEIVKKPRRLNSNKFIEWEMLANKMYSKWYILWKQKWVDKEITPDEYFDGYNIQLLEEDFLFTQQTTNQ